MISPHRLIKYASILLLVLFAAFLDGAFAPGTAYAAAAAEQAVPRADFEVIGARCKGDRVVQVVLLVKTPGAVVLDWDNDSVCGKAV